MTDHSELIGASNTLRNLMLVVAFGLGAWALAWAGGFLPTMLGLRDDIVFLGRQHIQLVAISGGLAIGIGVPLGVALTRPPLQRLGDFALQALNIGATIPTLAVLALSMSLLGIGNRPAIFALLIATILPIVSNTLAGIRAVPSHLIEAAQGMGMSNRQVLWQVELPNAMFVIYAGIRTALAINVGWRRRPRRTDLFGHRAQRFRHDARRGHSDRTSRCPCRFLDGAASALDDPQGCQPAAMIAARN
jgi:osmoprotectant transport system permease protein